MDNHQHRMDWQRGWWDFRHRRTYYLDTRSSMSGWKNQDLVTKSFFWLLYVPKTDLPEGLINDSSLEQDFDLFHSLLHMPCSGYGPLKCFLNWHSTLQGNPTIFVCCLMKYRQTKKLCCVWRHREVPRHCQVQLYANFDCVIQNTDITFYDDR